MRALKIVWSDRATRDLFKIREYVGLDKPKAALDLVKRIKKTVERLVRFPDSGRCPPELLASSTREVLCGNYRIVYRKVKDKIVILTVFASYRQFTV